MTKLTTRTHRLNVAEQVRESVSELANTTYYLFVGDHTSNAESLNVSIKNSLNDITISPYTKMIYGKKIETSDVALMIRKNMYTSNKIYEMYDDQTGETSIDMFDYNFYCISLESSNYHVFKCLENNNRGLSTVQPLFSETGVDDESYTTSDGYTWKYMYSIDSSTKSKFETAEYFPLISNVDVEANVKKGRIDVIKVEAAGRGYDNYCNGVFKTSDLRVNGNTFVYGLDSSPLAKTTNSYYRDCYLVITAGTGVGQYRKILDYVVNTTIKTVILASPFTVAPTATTSYEVSPGIEVKGNGSQTVKTEARAIVNTSGNTVQRIDILNGGLNYKYAVAKVLADPVVNVSNTAIIRPILSPPNGHGANAALELGSSSLCLTTKISNTDPDIPLTNQYKMIGVLKDPKFQEVTVEYTSTGTFQPLENVYKVKGVRISDNANMTVGSKIITANADFSSQLATGDYIYLATDVANQLAVVNAVTNTTYMTVASNALYSCSAVAIFKTTINGNAISGKVISIATSTIILDDADGKFAVNDKLIGSVSGTIGTITQITRGGNSKTFSTFLGLTKYTGSPVTGTFIQDEIVFQSPTNNYAEAYAEAKIHSVKGSGPSTKYFVTEQIGTFNLGINLLGKDSSAIAHLTDKYNQEISFGSGDVVYLEKIEDIIRTNSNSERIKFVLEF